MAEEQEFEQEGMDERDPYYGIHESDFTPKRDTKPSIDPHIVDKFLTFQADAMHAWILAGMPMNKAMSLVRMLHNMHFIMFGKANIKMDMANVLAAYAGRDGLLRNMAHDIATHSQSSHIETQAATSLIQKVFGRGDTSGVSPAAKGER